MCNHNEVRAEADWLSVKALCYYLRTISTVTKRRLNSNCDDYGRRIINNWEVNCSGLFKAQRMCSAASNEEKPNNLAWIFNDSFDVATGRIRLIMAEWRLGSGSEHTYILYKPSRIPALDKVRT
jgi:hypothetical protein